MQIINYIRFLVLIGLLTLLAFSHTFGLLTFLQWNLNKVISLKRKGPWIVKANKVVRCFEKLMNSSKCDFSQYPSLKAAPYG